MKSEKIILGMMILLAAGLLAGCCHKDEPVQRHEIAMKTGVSGMLRRANTIDNDIALQGKDLKIDAYFHDRTDKYLDGKKLHYDLGHTPSAAWVFWDGSAQEHYYWPATGAVFEPSGVNITYTALDFVGYCPFDKPAYIGTPTYAVATGVSFTCNVSSYMTNTAQASMQEYLIAVLDSQTLQTQTDAGGALPMQFKHPFALVKFVIAAESGTHVSVDSIAIAGLHTAGTCTYDGSTMTWSSLSGSDALKIVPDDALQVGTVHTQTVAMMVIPNNYGAKTLGVRASWDDWSVVEDQTITADVNFNWEAGYSYTYNLTVTPYALKVDISKFTEQW